MNSSNVENFEDGVITFAGSPVKSFKTTKVCNFISFLLDHVYQ